MSQLFWYVLLAGSVWLWFYVIFYKWFRHRRVGADEPTKGQILREVSCSLRSIGIFGMVAVGIVYAASVGRTKLYFDIGQSGWAWFWLSIVIMIVVHDTYFYWSHRLLHHPRLYRSFHHTHHISTSPSPWAAYAFSPVEAMIQAGIGPLILFTIPVHPAAFAVFMIWQISFNVFGHCGYEIFPNWFLRSRLGILFNSVTHHTLHHEKYRANFGLYFNVWDRMMGTNHPDYEMRFDSATKSPAARDGE